MRTAAWLVLLALAVAGCGSDRYAGLRYRAERDLWKANWEQRSLSIQSGPAGNGARAALAAKYEAIADRYGSPALTRGGGAEAQEVRAVAARALFAAIEIRDALQDSARVEEIYRRLARDFDDLPQVAAEVALARGRVAEDRGDAAEAADFYQIVVDRVPPQAGAGLSRAVLELPRRIAVLRSRGALGGITVPAYATAQAYYEKYAGDDASDSLQCDCRMLLAEVAADQRQWDRATGILQTLETQLRATDRPARDPCEVRFAIGGIQSRAGADPEIARATLSSILADDPDCPRTAQTLLALAANAQQRGRIDEALGYLDRVVQQHADQPDLAAQAWLIRARMLDAGGRWPEALEAYRSLTVQFPISPEALQAPVEIAARYERVGDTDARATALQQAERDYRSLMARYPAGPLRLAARERLVQTLALEQRYDDALTELTGLAEELSGTARGAALLVQAARMAFANLSDTTRAITLLERAGTLYGDAPVGRWAAGEARRLRGTMAR